MFEGVLFLVMQYAQLTVNLFWIWDTLPRWTWSLRWMLWMSGCHWVILGLQFTLQFWHQSVPVGPQVVREILISRFMAFQQTRIQDRVLSQKNDYTCDVDNPSQVLNFQTMMIQNVNWVLPLAYNSCKGGSSWSGHLRCFFQGDSWLLI